MKQIAAVILAAGASTRFGQCKQLLDWNDKPFLAHVSDVALEATLDPVIVVLGCQAEEVQAALGDRSVQAVMNWRWEEGMSTSVQIGLAALPPTVDAALFLQCDQPLVTPELLKALADRFRETEAPIVHPVHDGQRGTPVLFARQLFHELAAVTGDEGGRSLINRHAEKTATVEIGDPLALTDVDTPEDYDQLLEVSDSTASSKPEAFLPRLRHLIIDMDGVLWRGDEPMPGLRDFFAFLRRHDIAFMLATNNSSRTPEQYAAKLARFGVDVDVDRVLTSALVSAAYLSDVAPADARVYVIGGEGIQRALDEQGFLLTDEEADYVVVGWDQEVTWQEMATASLLIHKGAAFVGTNPDKSYPTQRGPVPGNGAVLAALEATTGVEAVVTGKPEPRMYEEALQRMGGAQAETTAMIGDRLDTDIAGAKQAGLHGVLVLSGIATENDVTASSVQPDLICADIEDLTAVWKRALSEE